MYRETAFPILRPRRVSGKGFPETTFVFSYFRAFVMKKSGPSDPFGARCFAPRPEEPCAGRRFWTFHFPLSAKRYLRKERACKPGSVEGDHLSVLARRRAALAALPGRSAGSFNPPLFGLAPGGVCQASASRRSWWSLAPPFQLSCLKEQGFLFCGTFLIPTSGTVAVGNHLALRSPDFPPRLLGAITRLAL